MNFKDKVVVYMERCGILILQIISPLIDFVVESINGVEYEEK